MDLRTAVEIICNFLVIAGLISYGYHLFADYHSRGRWAKNVTNLLAGAGLMMLAVSLLLTPMNVSVLAQIARTKASVVFLWGASFLLLAAIVAFGIITHSRPLRLWHERKIQQDLERELPKIQ